LKEIYMRIRFFTIFSSPALFSCLLLAVLFAGCFNPLDYNAPDNGNGLIHVALPGAGAAKMMLTDTYRDSLSYEVTFSGPGGQMVTKTASWGDTCTVEVAPGLWTVTVKAKDASNNEIAIGETVVNVQAGSQNNADITMTVLFQSDLTGTFNHPVAGEAPDTTGIDTVQYTGTVAWKNDDDSLFSDPAFVFDMVYKAVVTLTAKPNYTFDGVAADSFTYSGATVTHSAGSGDSLTVTIVFPSTDLPEVVSLFDLTTAFDVPVAGAVPDTTLTGTTQYTGSISWSSFPVTFAANTVYTATVILNANSGYTFDGVAAGRFDHDEATSVTHSAGSGSSLTVMVTFPATATTIIGTNLSTTFAAPAIGVAPVTSLTLIGTNYTAGTITWTPNPVTFAADTVYTAIFTLNADTGYTFAGLAADIFTYTGATSVSHSAGSGTSLTVTVTFPKIVSSVDLAGAFDAPVAGAAPDTTGTNTSQYTMGPVTWKNNDDSDFTGSDFSPGTVYKAVVTLTAETGYTFTGILANSFTYTAVSGATVANAANSGTVTITFPATGSAVVSLRSLDGKVTAPVAGAAPVTTAINTTQYTGTVAWKNSSGTSFTGSNFSSETVYKALVTLTAETGYTFDGVTPNSFTYTAVSGATVTNAANSGTVTITFPATGYIPITSQAGLEAIGASSTARNGKYILMNDLNITGSLTAICTEANPFNGTFDGNGKTIAIGSISGGSNVGLFAYNTGSISNLTVTVSGTVSGTGGNVGVIAGKNEGTITNCSVNATVSASSYAGGIVGDNRGIIQNCLSTGSVTTTGGINAGGIAGINSSLASGNPQILRCFSSADVTVWSNQAGGIVGSHEKGTVENCYSTGDIRGDNNCGGIAGATDNATMITKCYSSSEITANTSTGNAGGIVGGHLGDGATVQYCVALNSQINGQTGATYRIAGYLVSELGTPVLGNNYGLIGIDGVNIGTDEKTLAGKNGADVSSGTSSSPSFWATTLGWAFGTDNSSPWQFNNVNNLPELYFEP
jgi:hypothetical protein